MPHRGLSPFGSYAPPRPGPFIQLFASIFYDFCKIFPFPRPPRMALPRKIYLPHPIQMGEHLRPKLGLTIHMGFRNPSPTAPNPTVASPISPPWVYFHPPLQSSSSILPHTYFCLHQIESYAPLGGPCLFFLLCGRDKQDAPIYNRERYRYIYIYM